jgi:hypothetical protein
MALSAETKKALRQMQIMLNVYYVLSYIKEHGNISPREFEKADVLYDDKSRRIAVQDSLDYGVVKINDKFELEIIKD